MSEPLNGTCLIIWSHCKLFAIVVLIKARWGNGIRNGGSTFKLKLINQHWGLLTTKLSFQGSNLIITKIYMLSGFGFPNLLSLYFGVLIIVVVLYYTQSSRLQALNFKVLTNCCVSSLLCAHYRLGSGLWSFNWLLCFIIVVCILQITLWTLEFRPMIIVFRHCCVQTTN
jgi:hypothetical protein